MDYGLLRKTEDRELTYCDGKKQKHDLRRYQSDVWYCKHCDLTLIENGRGITLREKIRILETKNRMLKECLKMLQ